MRPFRYLADTTLSATIAPDLQRRNLLSAAAGFAAVAMAPGARAAQATPAAASDMSPLQRHARMLGGRDGEDILWWFMEELYLHVPGDSVRPLCRPMAIGVVRGLGGTDRDYRYQYREAGVLLDLATAEPMVRNPLTGDTMETPLAVDLPNTVEWSMQPDGTVAKKAHDRITTSHQRWTITRENVLLLETEPGNDAFGLASGDTGADSSAVHSTHTFNARRKDLERDGFVPAQWVYNIATRTIPAWLGPSDGRDRRLIVRGLGTKSRARDIVNHDTLDWVRRYFPGFL